MSGASAPPQSLYVSVPSRRPRPDLVAAWFDAVAAEFTGVVAARGWSEPLALETIYVGGGAVSAFGVGAMGGLAERLEAFARWDKRAVEWTVEADPADVDERLARAWRAAGVTRVSLAVEAFHGPSLEWLGRSGSDRHPDPGRAAHALAALRRAGFSNVNVDLAFGLPERLGRSWPVELDRALALEPEHITLLGPGADPGTGRVEYLLAAERLAAAGFRHYERTHFARPGRESRHNRAYWRGRPYLGLGPGAHSYEPPVRRWNLADWHAYRSAVGAGEPPIAGKERIDGADARLEACWLGLRTAAGVPLRRLDSAGRTRVREWEARGWAETIEGAVRLSPRGWLLLDELAVRLAGDGLTASGGGAGISVQRLLDRDSDRGG